MLFHSDYKDQEYNDGRGRGGGDATSTQEDAKRCRLGAGCKCVFRLMYGAKDVADEGRRGRSSSDLEHPRRIKLLFRTYTKYNFSLYNVHVTCHVLLIQSHISFCGNTDSLVFNSELVHTTYNRDKTWVNRRINEVMYGHRKPKKSSASSQTTTGPADNGTCLVVHLVNVIHRLH